MNEARVACAVNELSTDYPHGLLIAHKPAAVLFLLMPRAPTCILTLEEVGLVWNTGEAVPHVMLYTEEGGKGPL